MHLHQSISSSYNSLFDLQWRYKFTSFIYDLFRPSCDVKISMRIKPTLARATNTHTTAYPSTSIYPISPESNQPSLEKAISCSPRKWEFHERPRWLWLQHQVGFQDYEDHRWIDAVYRRHLNSLVDRGYNSLGGGFNGHAPKQAEMSL